MGPTSRIPIRSPFFDGSGDPTGPALVADLGNITRPWVIFLQSLDAVQYLAQLLVSGITTTVPSPTGDDDGQLLAVVLQQPGTGGAGAVAWDAGFSANTPTTVLTAANSFTPYLFVWCVEAADTSSGPGSQGLWLWIGGGGATTTPPSGGGSGILRAGLTHGTPYTVIPPTGTADGQTLFVFLGQPSGGGGQVVWGPGFAPSTPTAIGAATSGSVARAEFSWSAADSEWVFVWMNAGGAALSMPAAGTQTGGASGSIVFLLRAGLVHGATTTIASPTGATDGQLLTVLLGQPSDAGALVAWDSGFSADTPTGIDTATAGAVARADFVWSAADSKWLFLEMDASGPALVLSASVPGGMPAPGAQARSGTGTAAALVRQTLVHGATTTVASPLVADDGQPLVAILTQPSDAGGLVAWDAGFSSDTPTAIDTVLGGSTARVKFCWSSNDSKWIFLSMNAGGTI